MSQKIGVVALTATGSTITLYLDNGDTKELSAASYRTKQIVDEVLPIVARKEVAYVDLDSFSLTGELQKKSNGVLRFFRRVKNAVKSVVGLDAPAQIDSLSERARKVLEQAPAPASINHPSELRAGETLVAMIDDQEVEGVEALVTQMEDAVVKGSTKGLENFLRRLAAVAKERKHTADELLNFMKKGDLPIADDGSIIAYKMLYSKETTVDGVEFEFVDPHSRRVSQKVGARVEMPISSVNDDRRTLCSNGLHVARRDYIGGFNGDVITLIRIAPEDVIAVPYNEPSKMRVRGYDILARVPQAGFNLLKLNKPMTTDQECAKLLGAAIAGELPEPTVKVEVLEEMGKKLRVTVNGMVQAPKRVEELEAEPVQALEVMPKGAVANRNAKPVEGLDAKSISKAAKKAQEEAVLTAAMTGDVSVAISASVVTEKPQRKTKQKPVPPTVVKDQARLDAEAEAVRLVKSGVSQREAARQTGVSARAIGRLLSKAS